MRQLSPDKIKNVLKEEFSQVEPSNNIWQNVADTLPTPPIRYSVKRKTYRTALVAAILAISVFTLAAAGTDPGKEMLDQIFNSFGIHLVENTPQFEAQLKREGIEPDSVAGVPLEENRDKIPDNMKLPTYLPKNSKDYKHNSLYVYTQYRDVSIRWSEDWGDDKPFVMVEYHEEAFGKGSRTITNGEATEMQEVQICNIEGFAFKDNNGWNVSWAMDGHQYGVMTNISLEEAIKVAESIK